MDGHLLRDPAALPRRRVVESFREPDRLRDLQCRRGSIGQESRARAGARPADRQQLGSHVHHAFIAPGGPFYAVPSRPGTALDLTLQVHPVSCRPTCRS